MDSGFRSHLCAHYKHPGDDGINDSALNKSEWFVHFFFSHRCYCNVLGSHNLHPLTETYTILPKVLGHPLLMNRFDYFSNFYEYKS